MSPLQSTECGICHSRRHEPLLGGVAGAARCRACGTGYTTVPLPPGAEDLFDGRVYRGYFTRADQWRMEAGRRLDWLLTQARPHRLVEVGSAGGFFLEAARLAGIDAHGVELSDRAAAYALGELRVPVRVGAFEDMEPEAGFDALCAFHVLEHVEDPRRFLRHAAEHLRPGGTLALEVPNVESARARRVGRAWAGLQLDRHRWHFSPDSLAELVRRCGFAVQAVDTVSPRHYMRPGALLSRPGIAMALQDRRGCGSWRTSCGRLGDYLRVLAVRR